MSENENLTVEDENINEGENTPTEPEELPIEDKKKAVNLQDLVYVRMHVDNKIKSEIRDNYYTKKQIDENHYTKEEVDRNHYDITEMKENYYDKTETDETFYKKTDTVDDAKHANKSDEATYAKNSDYDISILDVSKKDLSDIYKLYEEGGITKDDYEAYIKQHTVGQKRFLVTKDEDRIWIGDNENPTSICLPTLEKLWEDNLKMPTSNDPIYLNTSQTSNDPIYLNTSQTNIYGIQLHNKLTIPSMDLKNYKERDLVIEADIHFADGSIQKLFLRNHLDKIQNDHMFFPLYDTNGTMYGYYLRDFVIEVSIDATKYESQKSIDISYMQQGIIYNSNKDDEMFPMGTSYQYEDVYIRGIYGLKV